MENSFIENVNNVAAKLEEIVTANNLFNTESLSALEELKNLNITLIVEDFKKGNYLGNRKIDIDLSLNKWVELVSLCTTDFSLTGIFLLFPFSPLRARV